MHRSFSLRVLWCLLWIVAVLALPAHSADLAYRPPTGGLQISLTTNLTKVSVGGPTSGTLIPIKKDKRTIAPTRSLIASVALANRGNDPVKFIFLDRFSAERKFRFKVFNSEGTLVWESEGDPVEGATQVEAPIVKRSPWRRTINVPLVVNGTWLASGRYTLEASIDATNGIGATSIFEVNNSGDGYIPSPPNTGIKGRVVEEVASITPEGAANPDAQSSPLKGAYVTVKEILPSFPLPTRAPYSWSGYTDDEGRFTAPTPVGQFKVTASRVAIRAASTEPSAERTHVEVASDGPTVDQNGAGVVIIGPPVGWPSPINLSVSKEVNVALGQYTEATLLLPMLQYPSLPQVYSVDEVTAVPLQTLVAPATVRITAKGTALSSGWWNAQLVQRRSIPGLPIPIDVLEFDFVATPPFNLEMTVLSPITASKEVVVPQGIREVRIYSKTNSQSVALPQEP